MVLSGLIGVRGSGRSTILELMSNGRTFSAKRTGRFDANGAVVNPEDAKLERLAAFYSSQKVVKAEFTVIDYESVGIGERTGRGAEWLNTLQGVATLLAVIPTYLDDNFRESIRRRLGEISADLVIADLAAVERRLERLDREIVRAPRSEKPLLEGEQVLHDSLREQLEMGMHLSGLDLDATKLRLIGSFGFMTLKPMVVIINSGEDDINKWSTMCQEVKDIWPYSHTGVTAVSAAIECEAMDLSEDERCEILDSLGIERPVTMRMSDAVSLASDKLTVYTGSETEVRAWSVPRGSTALDFAAIIHTDLAQGFIRAEVIAFDELERSGSEGAARRRGLIRSEGKNYKLQPNEVVTVLFSR